MIYEWVASHTDAVVEILKWLIGALVASVWWAATLNADVKQLKKDVDGIAEAIPTERAKARKKG